MREVVFDTETTGLSSESDRVVEIGCVELEDLLPTGRTFHVHINPQRDVPAGAVKVHGLTYDFLKTKPTFRRVASKFLDFIQGARLVAHNASFDTRMINAELSRLGLPPLENEIIDTLPLVRKLRKGKATLDAACQHFGIDNSKRTLHGALLDSEILAEVYLHLRGGRQHAMSLKVDEVVIEEVRHVYGPRTIIRRGSDEERADHAAFIASIKSAIWTRYSDEPSA
jgi:DNA polymerase-3 subunit epsilon